MAKKTPKTQEDKNIESIERRYLYEKRLNTYLANEEINQIWDQSYVEDFATAWNNGWAIGEIMEYIGGDKWEIYLLAIDLLQKGKINGTMHIFKPRRKEYSEMNIDLGDGRIRIVEHKKITWVCLKDVWRWIKRPEHSYRKCTEAWGPDKRAKFNYDTNGGSQSLIFINTLGLSELCTNKNYNMSQWQRDRIDKLKGIIKNGIFEGNTDGKQQEQS